VTYPISSKHQLINEIVIALTDTYRTSYQKYRKYKTEQSVGTTYFGMNDVYICRNLTSL